MCNLPGPHAAPSYRDGEIITANPWQSFNSTNSCKNIKIMIDPLTKGRGSIIPLQRKLIRDPLPDKEQIRWPAAKSHTLTTASHNGSQSRNAHWQKPQARRLPHSFFFFFRNCTLLSRFTANFCQLQCSLSAKMWVWSFCSERHDATPL